VSTSALVHSTFSGCAGGTNVELYKIIGGPHAWPGGVKLGPGLDAPSSVLDATQVIWEFFAKHPKR
jgi:polyhydroxybutyrate depolymerase